MKALFLARWYPNKYDSMDGLFVERHAQAVSEYCDVRVLYVHSDRQCKGKYNYEYETKGKLKVLRVYYRPVISFQLSVISKIINVIRYLKGCYSGYRLLGEKWGKPDIIHVNVLTRAGLLALFLKKFRGIPYIVTEHWTRYLPITKIKSQKSKVKKSSSYKGWVRKCLTKIVVRNASAVMPVTNDLKIAMINHNLKNQNYLIVPNVVDTDLFLPSKTSKVFKTFEEEKGDKVVIIHVSCFTDKQKNISGILRVIKKLSETMQDFECRLVGDGVDRKKLEGYALGLGIKDKFVFFDGLLEGKDIVNAIQKSDFLLMFSNYENLPVVINEALSCGIPIVSSDVGGIAEIVNNEKGILVKAGDEAALLQGLIKMMDNYKDYDREKLRKYAVDNFSNEKVAKKFMEIYNSVISL